MKSTRQEVDIISAQVNFIGLYHATTASVLVNVEAILLHAISTEVVAWVLTTSNLCKPITIYVEPTNSPVFINEALLNLPPPFLSNNQVELKASMEAMRSHGAFAF
jgi:hypothetical protein